MNVQVLRVLSALLLSLTVGCSTTRLTNGAPSPLTRGDSGPLTATVSIASYQPESMEESNGADLSNVPGDLGIAGSVQVPIESRFRLNKFDRAWDESSRYEFHIRYHRDRDQQVEGVTSAFVYYDKKRWDFGSSRITSESVGGGIEAGALLYPFSREPSGFDFAFYPYVRGALGSSAGSYKRIPTATGSNSGDLGDYRIEGGVGLDLRLLFGETFVLGAGGGISGWSALGSAEERETNGAASTPSSVDFEGHDIYLRFSAELVF